MANGSEVEFMRRAIEKSRQSRDEDERPHPRVGAVAVDKTGKFMDWTCRGEAGLGEHAEYILLEKKLKASIDIAGSTVYTTLEPCTRRGTGKVPCAERLAERKVARVLIGMLDPDQTITGRGVLKLRQHGIAVEFFPSELMNQVEDLNREFTRAKRVEGWLPAVAPFGWRADLPPMDAWPAARGAKDILIVGQNLYMVLRQWPFFQRKLEAGCSLRLVMVDPKDDSLIALMSRGVVEYLNTRPDFISALDNIRMLRSGLAEENRTRLQVKTIDYVPTMSFQVLDGGLPFGTIIAELAPNRVEVQMRPHVMLFAGEPAHQQAYQLLLKNCEDMYREANPWNWQ